MITSKTNTPYHIINGNYASAIVHKNCPQQNDNRIKELCDTEFTKGGRIAIMPDFECYDGGMVGLSAQIAPEKINEIPPYILGNDIGCGVLLAKVNAKKGQIDLEQIDNYIKFQLFNKKKQKQTLDELKIKFADFQDMIGETEFNNIVNTFSTLGTGNHFIEIDSDSEDNLYIAIHTGSRKLGALVAQFYQALEKEDKLSTNLSYIEASRLVNEFARLNRESILDNILKTFHLECEELIDCPHNFVSKNNTVHKGSIEANKGEKVVIPLNMRDGIILGTGKGNILWNNSAPHGSGRKLSRSEAKKEIHISDYYKAMNGIYTTSVSNKTIDEAPQAYNDTTTFLKAISPTVEVNEILTPVYNYRKK